MTYSDPHTPLDEVNPDVIEAQRAPLWEDYVDIFASPAKVFRRREGGSWFWPLLIASLTITAISVASRGVLQPVLDAEFARQADVLRRNPQMTEEMIEKARGIGEMFQLFGLPIILFVTGLATGFVLWLVGKLFDSSQELSSGLMVAGYALVPRIVQTLLNLIQGLLLPSSALAGGLAAISFSPARFLGPSSSYVLQMALMRLDVFVIWQTVLLGIGLYVTGRVSKMGATVSAIIVFVLGSIPPILSALRAG